MGWNDIYTDPQDEAQNSSRFFLCYYDTYIASIELVTQEEEQQTKITIYGSPDKAPIPSKRPVSEEEWNLRFTEVMEAIQNLFQMSDQQPESETEQAYG